MPLGTPTAYQRFAQATIVKSLDMMTCATPRKSIATLPLTEGMVRQLTYFAGWRARMTRGSAPPSPAGQSWCLAHELPLWVTSRTPSIAPRSLSR
ncbi:hypothetical protein BN11_3400003 [Nostocoides australiense Ben110]|uniref:Uncharacterized protein n=1 Tax=Nostocoides australiense Ben110 TaxID=1193182 RepID=W6JYX1_9MICO|nr:hypothetical protein BN11_3400003 [Tetrasphaera australiensis Ben110]